MEQGSSVVDEQLHDAPPEVSAPHQRQAVNWGVVILNRWSLVSSQGQNNHRKKDAENFIQSITDANRPKEDTQSNNKTISCDEISAGAPGQNHVTTHSLALLFDKATGAEEIANSANQEEILRWYHYEEEFLKQVSATIHDGKGEVGEKKAKGMIYDKILEDLSILRNKRSGIATPRNLP